MAKEKILDIIKSSKVIDSAYDIKLNKGQGNLSASATRKDYVDGQDALKVSKTGDTMTGNLTVPAVNLSGSQSSAPNTVTRKDYVDGEIAKQVSKTGDTMTGVLKVNAEIQSLSNHSYRQVVGDYGTFWRNDGTNHYLMLTNIGDPYGTWNSFRPLRTELATGKIYLGTDSYVNNDAQKIFHDQYAPRITQSEYLDTGSDLNDMVMYTGGMVVSRFGSNAANRPPVGSSANTILGFNPTGGYKHQIAFTDGGTIYSRYTNNASWSNWGKVYTDIYRPTPAEVGAVNKTGDTMTGNLTVPTVILSGSQSSAPNSSTRKDYVDGEIAKQVAKTGDTMTGPLTIAPTSGANAEVVLNSTTTTESSILFRNGSVTRWKFYQDNSVESGSNVGSDLLLRANADDGSSLGFVFDIQRETQIMSFVRNPRTNATQDTASNALTRKDYVDGQVAALLARIVALESK